MPRTIFNPRSIWLEHKGNYSCEISELERHMDANKNFQVPFGNWHNPVTLNFRQFKVERDSENDILCWEYTFTGPGANKTTYTVFND